MSNLNIFFTLNGQNINMQAKSDEIFATVAYRYMQKIGKTQEALKFFFNGRELVLTAAKTLDECKIINQSKIDVVLASLVIGAK